MLKKYCNINTFLMNGIQEVSGSIPLISTKTEGALLRKNPVISMVAGFFLFAGR